MKRSHSVYFSWLHNSKFLRELESDCVDSEIIEEELRAIQDVPPATYVTCIQCWN